MCGKSILVIARRRHTKGCGDLQHQPHSSGQGSTRSDSESKGWRDHWQPIQSLYHNPSQLGQNVRRIGGVCSWGIAMEGSKSLEWRYWMGGRWQGTIDLMCRGRQSPTLQEFNSTLVGWSCHHARWRIQYMYMHVTCTCILHTAINVQNFERL